jgi:hypothetical protein
MKKLNIMNNLIEIYVNGSWNADMETNYHVEIYNKGTVHLMKADLYADFIDDLEEHGFDNYFCPQLFSHPDWNGIIQFKVN